MNARSLFFLALSLGLVSAAAGCFGTGSARTRNARHDGPELLFEYFAIGTGTKKNKSLGTHIALATEAWLQKHGEPKGPACNVSPAVVKRIDDDVAEPLLQHLREEGFFQLPDAARYTEAQLRRRQSYLRILTVEADGVRKSVDSNTLLNSPRRHDYQRFVNMQLALVCGFQQLRNPDLKVGGGVRSLQQGLDEWNEVFEQKILKDYFMPSDNAPVSGEYACKRCRRYGRTVVRPFRAGEFLGACPNCGALASWTPLR